MIQKLPRWVWLWASLLSAMAGMINAVGYLSYLRQPVTHLTGSTTLAAVALAAADFPGLLHLLALIGSFMLGAALSGAIVGDSALQMGRRYGLVLLLEALALIAAVPCLQQEKALGLDLASAACGLQNAMATTYSGTVIRTSHVTGMLTDLGIALGHLLRRVPVQVRRIQLSLAVIGGFVFGGVIGARLFGLLSYACLYLPAAMALFIASALTIQRLRQRAAERAGTD